MKAIDLSSYIINRCNYLNKGWVNNLKLNMIIYLVNILYLSIFHKFLTDDEFEPKIFGPIVREVYDKHFLHGGQRIYPSSSSNEFDSLMKINPILKSDEVAFINDVIDYFTKLDGFTIKEYFNVNNQDKSCGAWFHAYHLNSEYICKDNMKLEAGVKET